MSETDNHKHPHLIANRYRVQETLGKGGMGVVYRVTDVSTEREIALKQLRERDNQRKRQFMEELFGGKDTKKAAISETWGQVPGLVPIQSETTRAVFYTSSVTAKSAPRAAVAANGGAPDETR